MRSPRFLSIFALLLPGLALYACSSNDNNGSNSTMDGSVGGNGDATKDSPSQDSPGPGSDAPAPHDGGVPEGATCAVFDASGLDEASVTAGFEQVWQVYRCWGCHQRATQAVTDAGMGIVLSGNNDGLGDSGMTFPPNLTNDPTGIGCLSDTQVVQAILNGADPEMEGGLLCPSMPKWGTALPTADGGAKPGTPMDAGTAQEIVDFLRSLPPVANAVTDTTCPVPEAGTTEAGVDAAPGEAGADAADSGADAGADSSGD